MVEGDMATALARRPKAAAKQFSLAPSAPHSVVSLFSGCGGLDLGFRGDFDVFGKHYAPLPFKVVWANDNSPAACATYRRNLGPEIHCGDILESQHLAPESAEVVIGGFPCTDLSINGKRKGLEGTSSGLYRAMVDVVARCNPKVFVAENVKGLLMEYNKDALAQVLADFEALDYTVTYKLYLAADYEVPQMRERVFIVGTAPGVREFVPPAPVTPKGRWMTCKEAIGDLENMEESPEIHHIWSRAQSSADQGRRQVKADKPADTMRAEHHGNIQFHYSLPRRLSMREAARFQAFPDDFAFTARLRETERQVGNAVPPVMAWHIANAVKDCLA